MYIATIVLKQEQLLKRISAILIECGLFDSTILDGEGIENVAGQTNPLFRELRGLFGQELVYNRTIIVHVPEREILDDFIALCKREKIDFAKPDVGFVMAHTCDLYYGPEVMI
ncbi:MAG: hypothetical protein ACOCVC_02580 [Spirochaeta sp.]